MSSTLQTDNHRGRQERTAVALSADHIGRTVFTFRASWHLLLPLRRGTLGQDVAAPSILATH